MEAASPADAAAVRCAVIVRSECISLSSSRGSNIRFAGSYTAKNTAQAGTTPARFPPIPLYKFLQFTDAPPRAACRRVFIVSMGYNVASTAVPAMTPAETWPASSAASIPAAA
eukprot:CAMPEP_0203006580 /NCGR_PEP_ID=MMETSP1401-20130829/4842_1 /ASSEMBLY_ACC=CAM_ASM_000894 /TAXON_ID=38833 /ORGANISM="Micromonas pusilla, Strain CCAC1681" /LENGTH=112 /DNA_ID=CAMNT_0049748225 /DNA_START=562 /DNA_END=900 /DNA_ORIENTATION=-